MVTGKAIEIVNKEKNTGMGRKKKNKLIHFGYVSFEVPSKKKKKKLTLISFKKGMKT